MVQRNFESSQNQNLSTQLHIYLIVIQIYGLNPNFDIVNYSKFIKVEKLTIITIMYEIDYKVFKY